MLLIWAADIGSTMYAAVASTTEQLLLWLLQITDWQTVPGQDAARRVLLLLLQAAAHHFSHACSWHSIAAAGCCKQVAWWPCPHRLPPFLLLLHTLLRLLLLLSPEADMVSVSGAGRQQRPWLRLPAAVWSGEGVCWLASWRPVCLVTYSLAASATSAAAVGVGGVGICAACPRWAHASWHVLLLLLLYLLLTAVIVAHAA